MPIPRHISRITSLFPRTSKQNVTSLSAISFAWLAICYHLDQTRAVARQLQIQSIPAVYGFRGGELLDSFTGLLPEDQIKAWLERLLPSEPEQRATEASKIAQIDPQGERRRVSRGGNRR